MLIDEVEAVPESNEKEFLKNAECIFCYHIVKTPGIQCPNTECGRMLCSDCCE